MKRLVWSKLRSAFRTRGSTRKKPEDSLGGKLSVNEEYVQAFRTNSYMEICVKIQSQVRNHFDDTSSSYSSSYQHHLSDFLLKPRQQTLAQMIENSRFHYLTVDYFQASFKACHLCELLLQDIHQARKNYRKIKRAIKLCHKDQCVRTDHASLVSSVFTELVAFLLLKNPLSHTNPAQFLEFHDGNIKLLDKLTSKEKKMRRRVRRNRIWKKLCGIKTKLEEAFANQLDMAAKGMFILINDFDTMSRLATRLHDEIEHCRVVAEMCIRNGKTEILKEVVREFHMHQYCFLDQSQELEEHVYLCFSTINRSTSSVLQDTAVDST